MGIKHGGDDRPTLQDIFDAPDEFGLLAGGDRSIVRQRAQPSGERGFEEINQFVDQAGRPPQPDGDLREKALARRLASYRRMVDQIDKLTPYDRHGLLSLADSGEHVTSMDDIFASDAFGLLNAYETELFELEHVPQQSRTDSAEDVAQRIPCADYDHFEPVFARFSNMLRAAAVEVVRFQMETQIDVGDLFILQGVLCYIAEIDQSDSGEGRYNPRLRVIYDNGTESNLLLRSLARALYRDEGGRRVIRGPESVVEDFAGITPQDQRSGVIYIVRTLSDDPVLVGMTDLYKIGYTEQSVEQRIRNAQRDTAFLEAPVEPVVEIKCYNLNPRNFERLIHGFLHDYRLTIRLTGRDGKTYRPQEWFSVPLDTVREVVKRIADGTIVRYRIDRTTNRLVLKGECD